MFGCVSHVLCRETVYDLHLSALSFWHLLYPSVSCGTDKIGNE